MQGEEVVQIAAPRGCTSSSSYIVLMTQFIYISVDPTSVAISYLELSTTLSTKHTSPTRHSLSPASGCLPPLLGEHTLFAAVVAGVSVKTTTDACINLLIQVKAITISTQATTSLSIHETYFVVPSLWGEK